MDLSGSRDIAVIIFCIVGSAAAVVLTVVALSVYHRINALLESTRDIYLFFSELGSFLDKLRRLGEFFRGEKEERKDAG